MAGGLVSARVLKHLRVLSFASRLKLRTRCLSARAPSRGHRRCVFSATPRRVRRGRPRVGGVWPREGGAGLEIRQAQDQPGRFRPGHHGGGRRRKAHGTTTDPSGGASEPTTSGKRQAKPTAESQEARAARKTLQEGDKTLWRLRLGRVEPPFNCQVCGWASRGMGLVAREHCVLDSVRWTAFSPVT